MSQIVTYGEGGYNPDLPNDNIVEVVELPDPPVDEQELARESAVEKLSKLGLTEAEVLAIIGQ